MPISKFIHLLPNSHTLVFCDFPYRPFSLAHGLLWNCSSDPQAQVASIYINFRKITMQKTKEEDKVKKISFFLHKNISERQFSSSWRTWANGLDETAPWQIASTKMLELTIAQKLVQRANWNIGACVCTITRELAWWNFQVLFTLHVGNGIHVCTLTKLHHVRLVPYLDRNALAAP